MPLSLPGRVVLFDYGQVITRPQSQADRAALVAAAGVPAEDLWAAYQADRRRLDQGLLSTTDYWRGVGLACGADWDLARIHALWALDIRSWTTVEPGVAAVVQQLAAGGTRLALLSNAAADYGGLLRFSPLGALFERAFVSGELLLAKPDPAVYRYCAEALGVPPEDLVLVDDREENVRGAESIGVTGHVFRDPQGLRAFLGRLGAGNSAGA